MGLNWNLNYGGMITRQVKGKPDDETNLPLTQVDGDGINEHGFLVGLRQNEPNLPTNDQVFNYNSSYIQDTEFGEYLLSTGSKRYEAQPDIFNFNFIEDAIGRTSRTRNILFCFKRINFAIYI